MCRTCQSILEPEWQIDYLKRYVKNQQDRLDRSPEQSDLAEEIEKNRLLLARLEKEVAEAGDQV